MFSGLGLKLWNFPYCPYCGDAVVMGLGKTGTETVASSTLVTTPDILEGIGFRRNPNP